VKARETYGISELAVALGVTRTMVTLWRYRQAHGLAGSRGLPKPDEDLAMGPIWRAATIEPWLAQVRAELE
jgi:hypothetical protein